VIFDPSDDTTRTLVSGQGTSTPAWNTKGKLIAYGDGMHLWWTSVAKPSPTEITLPDTVAPSSIDWLEGPAILFAGAALDCANAEGCLATGASDVWTVRPNGTALTEITSTGDASAPKWSSDGTQILYVRTTTKKKFGSQLWMANPDGTAPHQVTDWKDVVAADWSPDGTRLVILRQAAGTDTLEFWVGPADGTGMVLIGSTIATGTPSVDW
jgi:Tol biopolymer transport system component